MRRRKRNEEDGADFSGQDVKGHLLNGKGQNSLERVAIFMLSRGYIALFRQ